MLKSLLIICLLLCCSWNTAAASVFFQDNRAESKKESTTVDAWNVKHECELEPFCPVKFNELFEDYLKSSLDMEHGIYLPDSPLVIRELFEAFCLAVERESGSLVLFLEVALKNQVSMSKFMTFGKFS